MPGINSHYLWGSNCLWYFISRKDSEDNLRPGAPNLTKKKRRECLELIAQNFPISTPSPFPHFSSLSPTHWKWKSQKQEKNVLINKLNVCENWKDFPCSVFSSRDPELLLASSCLFVVVVVVPACCCCCWGIHLGALICRPRSFCMQMIYAKKCLAARQNWIRLCQPRVESSHSLLLYSHSIMLLPPNSPSLSLQMSGQLWGRLQ